MKDQKTKERFVELRAQGLSFVKISQELDVSKQTLIDWSKKFEFEVRNRRAIELEALQEKYFITKQKRIEVYAEWLEGLKKEWIKRDLSEISTEKLFDMLLRCSAILKDEIADLVVFQEAEESVSVDDVLSGIPRIRTWSG